MQVMTFWSSTRLRREDLKVSAAVADPNAQGHRDDTLAWFWTMDVPWDTEVNDWMLECKSLTSEDITA